MKKLILLSIGIISLLPACKKNDSDDNSSKIMGKWTMVQDRSVTTVNGVDTRDTLNFASVCYADFHSDGTVYSYMKDTTAPFPVEISDTLQYRVQGNTLYTATAGDWHASDIITLTGQHLSIRSRDTSVTSAGTEITVTESDLIK
ncbi:lipocalin family protein [Taibaiella soli]|uniref:Lipocalin-like domain-containing protein n=1 Tax=Taibaiella soli TaxID=1649169 RepID=A0A2W2B3L5_9BACT|nr:lipocalin family protein [Taibaiella soli]PZF74598.1 hypothetical protein DN068_03200 [Taibaiella soli]